MGFQHQKSFRRLAARTHLSVYAVTRFENLENIGRVWSELAQWREASKYRAAHHQWLENLLNPLEVDFTKYMFDLYLPITE